MNDYQCGPTVDSRRSPAVPGRGQAGAGSCVRPVVLPDPVRNQPAEPAQETM